MHFFQNISRRYFQRHFEFRFKMSSGRAGDLSRLRRFGKGARERDCIGTGSTQDIHTQHDKRRKIAELTTCSPCDLQCVDRATA